MYIVGTSGHIDHGKTSLIRALTGIDCDRLPEEKEREMTIDIGFASIEYPKFGTVSIIDVPGHERFIRNMVAGAWGVDLALLVIALDDGWMLQTEDHFRVLQLLGIERLIVVINKIDLGDEEMLEMVKEEVRERLADTPYSEADIAAVSAKAGTGIAELKELILVNLRKLSKAPDSDKPYLYIDRVFSPKGVGTVITGTLKNGIFRENETVSLLPMMREVKIKKIESHYKELQEGVPSQRTALNLTGVSQDELERGDIVCRPNFFTQSDDVLAWFRPLDKKKKVRNNTYVEVLTGTDSSTGKLIIVNTDVKDENAFPVRIHFDEKSNFYPGQPFVLTNPGGYRIIGGGRVILPDYNPLRHKKIFREHLDLLKSFSPAEVLSFSMAVNGVIKRERVLAMLPSGKKAIERIIGELESAGDIIIKGEMIFWKGFHSESTEKMKSVIKGKLGPNLKEISDSSGVPFDICSLLIKDIVASETLVEKDGRYFTGDSITPENLPESKKRILADVLKSGGEGIEIDRLKDDIMKKEVKDLIKLDFLVSLDGNIIYHRDVYNDMKRKVLTLFDTRDKITVPEAKDAVDLSRKYILPLLNRIESDGLIKRLGDFRIKV
jgi:selenocysteine-specific elongation factor